MKNSIMEGKCGTNWTDEKCTHKFGRKTQGKKKVKDKDVDGKIIFK